jgi:MFS transporter, DHA2 family, multidrug resistance protein
VNVPIVVVALVLMTIFVPNSRNPNPGRLDPAGVLLSIAAITAIVFGIVRGGDIGFGSLQALAALILGASLFTTFLIWERRFPSPVLDTKLFRDKRFSAAVAIIALVFCAYMGLVFVISFYFQAARGYSPLHSGTLLLPLAAGQLFVSSRSAGLVQRFGARKVVSGGMLVLTGTFAYYTQAGSHSPVWPLELILLLQGAAIACVMPPSTATIMAAVPRHKAGEGSAIGNTARQVGGCLGVAILGAIMTSAYRAHIDPQLAVIPAIAHAPGGVAAASASITATLTAAGAAGAAGHAVIPTAIAAFISALHKTALGSVLIALLGAVTAIVFIPSRIAPAPVPQPAPATDATDGTEATDATDATDTKNTTSAAHETIPAVEV